MKQNKIVLSLITLMLLFSGIFGATLVSNQDDVLSDYNKNEHGNIQELVIYNSDLYSVSNKTGNYLIHYSNILNNIYFTYDNSILNNTVTFYLNCRDANNNFMLDTYNISMLDKGRYIFEIKPMYKNEYCDVLIDINETYKIMTVNEDYSSDTSLFSPLIDGVVSLIKINISIWFIFYYLLITAIIIGSVSLVVLLLYKLYNFILTKKPDLYNLKNNRGTRK